MTRLDYQSVHKENMIKSRVGIHKIYRVINVIVAWLKMNYCPNIIIIPIIAHYCKIYTIIKVTPLKDCVKMIDCLMEIKMHWEILVITLISSKDSMKFSLVKVRCLLKPLKLVQKEWETLWIRMKIQDLNIEIYLHKDQIIVYQLKQAREWEHL